MSEVQNYDSAVEVIKTAILQSQYDAVCSVNEKQLMLYYGIGKYISLNSRKGFWGKGAIDAISERLEKELPGLKGFSARNLRNMRTFYEAWIMLDQIRDEELNLAEASAKTTSLCTSQFWQKHLPNSIVCSLDDFLHIGFSHHILIISKVKTTEERAFYIHQTVVEKMSLDALKASIARDDYHHQGSLPNNFVQTLSAAGTGFPRHQYLQG